LINKENIETKNKQKTLSDILKGTDDFLFRTLPEAVIGGISKGLGLGVGILSDYVKNPVQNIAFDAATLGLGKGIKGIGLAAGLLNPKIKKGSVSLFRGDENVFPTTTSMQKLVEKGKRIGGGKKIFTKDKEIYPGVLYSTLFPKYAERYASGFTLSGSKEFPGTVSQFQIPHEYISRQNKVASAQLVKLYENIKNKMKKSPFEYSQFEAQHDMRRGETRIMRDVGQIIKGSLGENKYPSFSDLEELAELAAKNPEDIKNATKGVYRFRKGIPIKFLENLEFVPGKNTSYRQREFLNNPDRIKELISYLKELR
tara:strand:- start:206 stop:1144 length:939 start_codon:yes stop_codon:yes gene_type:complete